MSVSLREQVAKIITKFPSRSAFVVAGEILALFPSQLTEEEVEKILPKE